VSAASSGALSPRVRLTATVVKATATSAVVRMVKKRAISTTVSSGPVDLSCMR
jgi:hypothetical protein